MDVDELIAELKEKRHYVYAKPWYCGDVDRFGVPIFGSGGTMEHPGDFLLGSLKSADDANYAVLAFNSIPTLLSEIERLRRQTGESMKEDVQHADD